MAWKERRIFRHFISMGIYYSGLLGILRNVINNNNIPLIINYHEVFGDDDDISWCNFPYLLTPEKLFSEHLQYVAQQYKIVSLEEIYSSPAAGLAAITFDDGYKGVYSRAFPLLRKMGIPATVFLSTDFIGSSTLPWWENIARRIKSISTLPTDLKREYLKDAPEKWRYHLDSPDSITTSIYLYKRSTAEEKILLDRFLDRLSPDAQSGRKRIFLNMDEIYEMKSAGITFGSHTKTHPILSWLDDESLRTELEESRDIIIDINGTASCWFAYPNGIFTEREERVVQELGFTGAVQTSCYPDKTGRFSLPRIDLVDDNTTGFDGKFSKSCTEVALARITRESMLKLFL